MARLFVMLQMAKRTNFTRTDMQKIKYAERNTSGSSLPEMLCSIDQQRAPIIQVSLDEERRVIRKLIENSRIVHPKLSALSLNNYNL